LPFFENKQRQSSQRLSEESMYEYVIEEISENKIRTGLWAKAIAHSEGNEQHAKSLYIKYRVQSLKDEMELVAHESHRREREARKRNRETERDQIYLTQQIEIEKQNHEYAPFYYIYFLIQVTMIMQIWTEKLCFLQFYYSQV